MTYNKRILYMDFCENGIKQTNAGFVKLIQWGDNNTSNSERTCMQICVSKFPLKEDTEGEVKIIKHSGEVRLGRVKITDGKGMMQVENLEEILREAGMMNTKEEILLKVEFAPHKCLECVMQNAEEEKQQEVVHEAEEMIEPNIPEVEAAEFEEGLPEEIGENNSEKAPVFIPGRVLRVRHDKWKQMEGTFSHIRPFEDEREYLKINLEDMIVLSNTYYRLAENSFLLHGYYNYGHLILTKVYKRGEEKIYIGVPGNYYEKEAQVAVMFGFESFEPKAEPAREGDFGYYMIEAGI